MKTLAEFKTEKASQYLASLCQHFGHKVPVQSDGTFGRIALPFARCNLRASDTVLTLEVSADTQADLEQAAGVIANHLERFAVRESPRIEWQPTQPTPTEAT